jgi:large subunit ribosomal protein L17
MRHRKKGRRLNRTWSHRKAMMRNMVTTFIELEKIETTDAKAKEVRSLAERLVTLAKRGPDDLAARRQVLRVVRNKRVVSKLFSEIGPRYVDRPGGYTRIVKVENRRGDAAPLSILQFVTEPVTFKEKRERRDDEFEEETSRKKEPEPEPEEVVEEASEEAAGDDVEDAGEAEGETAEAEAEAPKEG